MAFREMNAKLQLKFNEFVETWAGLLKECYTRGLDQSIVDDLALSDEDFVKYSMELALAVLVTGMRMWMRSRIGADIKEKVRLAAVDSFYQDIFNRNDETFLKDCKTVFTERYKALAGLCPNLEGKNREKQRVELVGLARYICAQVSDRPEEEHTALFEKLGLVFIETALLSDKLTRNSSLDIQLPLGNPKFIVQK